MEEKLKILQYAKYAYYFFIFKRDRVFSIPTWLNMVRIWDVLPYAQNFARTSDGLVVGICI